MRIVYDIDRTARYRYRSLFKTKCHQVSMQENRNRCVRCRADPGSDPDHVWGSAAFVESYCRNHDALCRDCVCVGETKANSLLMENGDVITPTGSSGLTRACHIWWRGQRIQLFIRQVRRFACSFSG